MLQKSFDMTVLKITDTRCDVDAFQKDVGGFFHGVGPTCENMIVCVC